MELVFGVISIPYGQSPEHKKAPKAGSHGSPLGKTSEVLPAKFVTTAEVADILEEHYHIMEKFYERREDAIMESLHDALGKAIRSMMMGGPEVENPFLGALDGIEHEFKEFLDTEEMASTGTPGVPTKAALRGVNNRLKISSGPRRPSFIDTSLYQQSFKAWIE